jgi:branched-chain amino acid transport system permease protein
VVGSTIIAMAQNRDGAALVGIDATRVTLLVFAISGALAAVAAVLYAPINLVYPAMGNLVITKAFVIIILGGLGSFPGAIVGGLIIGASEKLAEIYIPPVFQAMFGGNFGGIEGWFPYVFALLFLLVRPEGLFGEKHIDRV